MAPLDVKYDLDAARKTFTRENIAKRPGNLWRYSELLPIPDGLPLRPFRGHDAAGRRRRAWARASVRGGCT